ncbi:recombinase family protein [Actinomadura coerulea]|uniref:recombinase family protein n=1 Tax=Actinomadura coerulea TaxID=46159 RepID=UPI00343E6E75
MTVTPQRSPRSVRPPSPNRGLRIEFRDGGYGTIGGAAPQAPPPTPTPSGWGYTRVSGRTKDHQMQLDALAAASLPRGDSGDREHPRRPAKAARHPDMLKPGDTLVIYKPDRIARTMKELLVLPETELHARNVNLEILIGICPGLHRAQRGRRSPTRSCSRLRHGRRDGTRAHP